MVTGQDIADQAELLIGSRWQRNGRGNPGYDCSGVVICAARSAGLTVTDCHKYDVRCVPAGLIEEFCEKNGTLTDPDVRDPGTVFLMSAQGYPGVSHIGIVSSYDRVIHMDASKHCVSVTSFAWLKSRCVLTMKFNGLE
jgi:cell wall-associated NlpC family hydrolase